MEFKNKLCLVCGDPVPVPDTSLSFAQQFQYWTKKNCCNSKCSNKFNRQKNKKTELEFKDKICAYCKNPIPKPDTSKSFTNQYDWNRKKCCDYKCSKKYYNKKYREKKNENIN